MKKWMKTTAVVCAAALLCGPVGFDDAVLSGLSIVADAAGECYTYNETTQTLTLKGNVDWKEIKDFEHYDDVKTIRAAEGTVLPEGCFELFRGWSNCTRIDLSNADSSNVASTCNMFYECEALTSVDLSSFDTKNVTDMSYMFYGCSSLRTLDLSSFDTSNVYNMACMFSGCSALESLDLSSFDTSKVTEMNIMFGRCASLKSLDLSNFDTSSVIYMENVFSSCSSLTSLDLSSFDTSNVTTMSALFYNCSALTSLDLSSFDTSNVTRLDAMFSECSALKSVDLSSFDTRNVTDMYEMFYKCSSLTSLDLSNFDTSSVTNAGIMFSGTSNLTMLTLGSNFGNIADGHYLRNTYGWANINDRETKVSGDGQRAEIENIGTNTYVRMDTLLKDGNYTQTAEKDGTYYTRFVFVMPKSECAGKNNAVFTATYNDKDFTYTTEKYYTGMISNGVRYLPASEDSVLFVVTVSSGSDIRSGLTCELDFE